MQLTREIAGECAEEGLLELVQKGQRVDPKSYKGPIRLRLVAVEEAKSEEDDKADDDVEALLD